MFGLQIIYVIENNMYFLKSLIRLMKKLIVEYHKGFILGPLLFLMYINDLSNVSSLFLLYADDTNMFVSGKSTGNRICLINTE